MDSRDAVDVSIWVMGVAALTMDAAACVREVRPGAAVRDDADRVAPSYARYLERSLRRIFGIRHAPMRLHLRSAHAKREKK